MLRYSLDKTKHIQLCHAVFSKNENLNFTIDLLSLVYMPQAPSFDLPTPSFAGSSNLNSFPGSGPGTES